MRCLWARGPAAMTRCAAVLCVVLASAGCARGAAVGSPDAGAMVDSGTPDAGAPDAGAPDAGAPDAGAPDAGAPDAGPISKCGNGTLDPDERCDDGNLLDGDGCSAMCLPEGTPCPGSPDMVLVPAATFEMGADSPDYANEAPVHQVRLDAFCIGRDEVTVDAYRACVTAEACTAPHGRGQLGYNYDAAGKGDHPVNGVTWTQAVAYCAWLNERLPTEAEWELAARGTDGRLYPWGDAKPSASLARYWAMNPNPRTTSPVGSYPAGVSPYGALDMAGNVWEWVADWYADMYPDGPVTDPTGPETGTDRVVRGGSWNATVSQIRVTRRKGAAVDAFSNDYGFRCAGEPAPAGP